MRLSFTFLISLILTILALSGLSVLGGLLPLPYPANASSALAESLRDRGVDRDCFMDVDAIEPGMRGYGKTVFSGKTIERFDVEVIGVMKNWEAKSDMILVKMSGASLDKTGIISGMSGSPVFIDEKMIGAVSYGWTFAKDAIAGVTPIGEMLRVLRNIDEYRGPNIVGSAGGGIAGTLEDEVLSRPISHDPAEPPPPTPGSYQGAELVPIKTPIMVSGFDSRVLGRMEKELEKYGLFPVQSGGGGGPSCGDASGDTPLADELQPGAAVAAVLVRGDLNASSIGTLTYREGDDIVAFGHPFFHIGNTSLPMSLAHVYTVIANQSTSFKVATATDVIGRISQDRKPGIAGTIGEYARMIPCEVDIEGSAAGETARYEFEIVHDKMLSPSLVQWAMESALLNAEKQAGPKMVKLRLTVELEGRHQPVEVENSYYVVSNRWDPVYDITSPVAKLLNNPFRQDVVINKISLRACVFNARRTALIEDVRVSNRTVRPGDTIQVLVTLRPFGAQKVRKTVSFRVPETTPPGHVITLTACNSQHSRAIEKLTAPDMHKPNSFQQLVRLIETAEDRTNLIVRLRLPKRGITYRGQRFPSLPSSLLSIMAFSNQSGVGMLYEEAVLRAETDWVLSGKQSLPLVVEDG